MTLATTTRTRLLDAAAIYEANAVYWDGQRGVQAEKFADFNRKTAAELRERAAKE